LGFTGCADQQYAVNGSVGDVGFGSAGTGSGAFAGTLTHHRTKIFGYCVIYSATITGSLTLTPSWTPWTRAPSPHLPSNSTTKTGPGCAAGGPAHTVLSARRAGERRLRTVSPAVVPNRGQARLPNICGARVGLRI
jgi:hypothetical protein